MISYCTDVNTDVEFQVRQFTFPGGEVGIDINNLSEADTSKVKKVMVTAQLQNSDDVMALLLTVDALKRAHPWVEKIALFMPYVPYARQDRVCNQGEALSIAVFADLINACGFSAIRCLDPHSSVTGAVIKNLQVVDQFDIFGKVKPSFRETYIVAPDAGAIKKCEDFAKRVGAAGVVTCSKTRELSTGEITGMSCDQDVTGLNLFVLDDICDGGRTFIELAKMFGSKPLTIELAVTHGIFSKGVEVVLTEFDQVYTTNSFRSDLNDPDWEGLTVIEVYD